MADNKLDVTSFVFSLVGLLLFWIPFLGLIGSILGVIFYSKYYRLKKSSGLAIAGLVLGILGIVMGGIMSLAIFLRFTYTVFSGVS